MLAAGAADPVVANPDCFQRWVVRAAFGYLAQARSGANTDADFVKDPLGIEGWTFNMQAKFQVQEHQ